MSVEKTVGAVSLIDVVIADDEPLCRELLRTLVPWESLGFRIAGEAKNGREALEQVGRLRPRLVMADISMPFMDGLAFGEQVKGFGLPVHIIYVTGHGDFGFTQRAIRLGADDYLLKPFNADELLEALARVRPRILQEMQRETGHEGATPEAADGMVAGRARVPEREGGTTCPHHSPPGTPKTRAQLLVEHARRYIEAHHREETLSVEGMAASLHVNPGYLRAIFRKECDCTVVDQIVDIRMQHAADLIRTGGIRFSDVALAVGMPDPAYFSKAFKKHFGMTPSEFELSVSHRGETRT